MASELPEQPIRELNERVKKLHAQGKYAEAVELARQACERARGVLGDDHADTATALNNLGVLLLEMANLADARPYLEQALEVRRRVLGENHADAATSLNNLGILLWRMGDLEAAWQYYAEALEIRRRVLGNDDPDTAKSLNNLGSLLRDMGDLDGARGYIEQALAILRRGLGADHPDTARILGWLGHLASAMVWRKGHRTDTATILGWVGQLSDREDLAVALRCYVEALVIHCRKLGDDHPDTATSRNNLGNLLRDLGHPAAKRYYLEALESRRRVLGDHPQTATSLNNLGTVEVASGGIDEALELLRQATAIDDRVIGQVFSIGSDRQRLLFLRTLRGNQERFLSLNSSTHKGKYDSVVSSAEVSALSSNSSRIQHFPLCVELFSLPPPVSLARSRAIGVRPCPSPQGPRR